MLEEEELKDAALIVFANKQVSQQTCVIALKVVRADLLTCA